MTLPPSAFLSSILEYYGLQPHNIAPNNILVLTGFQALFEGYLGIVPTVGHFRYCFLCHWQTIASGKLVTCGSVTFNCRQGGWYPKIPYNEYIKHWTSTFFYCKDILSPGKEVRIPAFINCPATHQPFWTEKVMTALSEEHRLVFRRLEFLTKTMEPPLLDSVDTIVCWLSRKIMPLRHRLFKMYEYQAETSGCNNGRLDDDTLLYRLKELIQPKMIRTSENVPMFTHDNPPPEVRSSLDLVRQVTFISYRILIYSSSDSYTPWWRITRLLSGMNHHQVPCHHHQGSGEVEEGGHRSCRGRGRDPEEHYSHQTVTFIRLFFFSNPNLSVH